MPKTLGRKVHDVEGARSIQEVWDSHCAYQWTYFDELIKQTIDFFLAQRLEGKNLDIGGGWYLPYPNSDVVDISDTGLKYNLAPAERKHHFDLDTIAEGAMLPFPKHSFDTATMISSWQYLKDPFAVMKELERVLKPGGEVYIINGQGAGLSECQVNSSHTNSIIHSLREKGYQTWWEQIPVLSCSEDFQSACVTLPGGTVKQHTLERERFLDRFLEHEARICRDKALQVAEYPITKLAVELRRRANAFSKDYQDATGNLPYIFTDFSLPPALGMVTALWPTELHPEAPVLTLATVERDSTKNEWASNTLKDKYGISAVRHGNYFSSNGIEKPEHLETALQGMLARDWMKCSSGMKEALLRFAVAVPVNEHAEKLVSDICRIAGQDWNGAAKELAHCAGAAVYQQTQQHKQRRRIDELIAQKKAVLAEPKNIIGGGRFDVPVDTIAYIKKAMRRTGMYSRVGFSDD